MDSSWMDIFTQASLATLPVLAPVATAAIKNAAGRIGASIPNSVKPLLNALLGVFIANLVGVDPAMGLGGAVLGGVVRDQLSAAAAKK